MASGTVGVSRSFRRSPRSCAGGSDRYGSALLNSLLLLDGLYLAFAMYGTGGTQSPIRFLVYLDLVAVSLLASYRTGLKIALWDSLLLFVDALRPGRQPRRRRSS